MELAPMAKLRAGINYGNVILATKDPASGELRGVHVDLARELARRLGVPAELAGHEAAGGMVEGLKSGVLDVAFLTVEPARASDVNFSPAYLEIEATYLVRAGSPLRTAGDVDRPGVRIAIAAKSAYEFYLSRNLKHARLMSASSTHAAFELFVASELDALVGLRPRLLLDAGMLPGSRVLDGCFMATRQTIASPKNREAAASFLREFVEDAKRSGLFTRLIETHGVRGVTVAPRAPVE
jgi:polar amino acid transport system substrate-binding protein